ncbi:DNA-directed RNA polymerase subunit [Rhynchospora pubera]|uniref:DNA-directed RNA polymerase I subunit RPA12 n=1 Tax=Rhynchospora pubera TaxID=906938 RepID=A0AAV8HK13_9POAL|nr:DNA-directed RNA polymerase subunit [Rhynchospora pubera]
MAFYAARDFCFCAVCGTSLSFRSPEFASCPLCGFKRNASEIHGIELSYTITAEDIRRELKLEPFVILETAPKQDEGVQRAVVNESCPKCNHPQLEYYTKQLRSADEGQTVFYECPECKYKIFALNISNSSGESLIEAFFIVDCIPPLHIALYSKPRDYCCVILVVCQVSMCNNSITII